MNENEFDQANQDHRAGHPAPLTRSHHSTTPSLHHSFTPSVHHSFTPSVHHSEIPPLRLSNRLPIKIQKSKIENPDVAQAAFALLEKLDSGRRRPPPSISRVFRLYCIDLLSAAQVARECRCSKAAVIRRLNLIRAKTGLPIGNLRIHYPQPGFLGDLPAGASSYRMNNKNYLYAGSRQDSFTE